MSAKEVKKKFHDMVDEFTEDCENPEIEQMAEELKKHGDQFVDALGGKGTATVNYRGNTSFRGNGGMGGTSFRGNGGGMNGGTSFRNGGMHYRNEGDWQEQEQKMQQLEQEMQQLRQQMGGGRYD